MCAHDDRTEGGRTCCQNGYVATHKKTLVTNADIPYLCTATKMQVRYGEQDSEDLDARAEGDG